MMRSASCLRSSRHDGWCRSSCEDRHEWSVSGSHPHVRIADRDLGNASSMRRSSVLPDGHAHDGGALDAGNLHEPWACASPSGVSDRPVPQPQPAGEEPQPCLQLVPAPRPVCPVPSQCRGPMAAARRPFSLFTPTPHPFLGLSPKFVLRLIAASMLCSESGFHLSGSCSSAANFPWSSRHRSLLSSSTGTL